MVTKDKSLKFSICIPTYNGAPWIGDTLKSILSQSFQNFEIIISDDCSSDDTLKVIRDFKDKRIKVYKNKKNLGYGKNLEVLRKKAKGEIIFLMGQDDILGNDAFLTTSKAFLISSNIGAVTRPYFWFEKNIKVPVRAKEQLNSQKDEVVTIRDEFSKIKKMFATLDQLSGLAYRRKYMDLPFGEDTFPAHVYPFAGIFKHHPVLFLKDYNVAVRIESSQSRHVPAIYEKSPIQSWVDMFEKVFSEKEFDEFRKYMIRNFVANNYIGLVQIRNFGKFEYLLREIVMLLKYRPENIFSPQFWFFSLGCVIIPPKILIELVDWYKASINVKRLKEIRFSFRL